MENNSKYWIEKLELVRHIEGGFYKQIYASKRQCQENGNRSLATCIFYLLEGNDFSAFHKINGDEIWHFFIGSSLTIYIFNENDSKLKIVKLGKDLDKGENLQLIINEGNWFAAEVNDNSSFNLVCCTVISGIEIINYMFVIYNSILIKVSLC